jgi:hypothetical protein
MMFSALRRRLHLSPTMVIATLALLFAMSGGAYAASRYVITSTKQISPKVLKSLQGKTGATGAPGATGTTGPAGPQGSAGATGPVGPQGNTGKEGTAGKEGTPGKAGEAGPEGSPWTDGGTLPSGKSEYGQWAYVGSAKGAELGAATSFSFPIPLSAPLDPPQQVGSSGEPGDAGRYIGFEEGEGEPNESGFISDHECGGTVADPSAGAGHLCVFAADAEDLSGLAIFDAAKASKEFGTVGKDGFAMLPIYKAAGAVNVYGTWVVTAE